MQNTYQLRSRYMNGGSPTNCANPNCREPFTTSAWRSGDGRYFCNEWCAEFAETAERKVS